MKTKTTQNRTEITAAESERVDFLLTQLAKAIEAGNTGAAAWVAKDIYHVVYPRKSRQSRRFSGRQLRVLAAIKAGR